MIHPKSVSDTLQASIRAFLMREGAIIAFVDPLAEMDQVAPSPMMPTLPQGQASDLNWLTEDWGVALRAEQILGDAQLALSVTGQNGAPTRHLGILGLGPTELNPLEVPTASLESINVASAGLIDVFEAKLAVTPLLSSSNYAGGMDAAQFQFLQDPSDLQKTFVPGSEAISIAVALSGVLPASEVLADPGCRRGAGRDQSYFGERHRCIVRPTLGTGSELFWRARRDRMGGQWEFFGEFSRTSCRQC